MAYARESDELRRELRRGVNTTFPWWPKVDGANVRLAAGATFYVYSPAGVLLQDSTGVSDVLVGAISRGDLVIDASKFGTALGEDYQIRITWREYGTTFDRFDLAHFDIVLYPFGPPSVSLNDLLEERPDVGEVLDRLGQLLGYAAGDAARETAAAVFAVRARVELDARIRDAVAADAAKFAAPSYTSTGASSSSDLYTRPRLILNRERLNRFERKMAMALVYAADASNPLEGDDEASALHRFYRDAAEAAWRGVGPLRYDSTETLKPSETLTGLGRTVRMERIQ